MQKDSGLNVWAYCKRNKISYNGFQYHKKQELGTDPGFEQVHLAGNSLQEQMELQLTCGKILRFPVSLLEVVLTTVKKHA